MARGRSAGSAVSTLAVADDSVRNGEDAQAALKMAHNIAMTFKDAATKFSGDIGKPWLEFIAVYQEVARITT